MSPFRVGVRIFIQYITSFSATRLGPQLHVDYPSDGRVDKYICKYPTIDLKCIVSGIQNCSDCNVTVAVVLRQPHNYGDRSLEIYITSPRKRLAVQ